MAVVLSQLCIKCNKLLAIDMILHSSRPINGLEFAWFSCRKRQVIQFSKVAKRSIKLIELARQLKMIQCQNGPNLLEDQSCL